MSVDQAYCLACGRYTDGPSQIGTVLCVHNGARYEAEPGWKPGGRRRKPRRRPGERKPWWAKR